MVTSGFKPVGGRGESYLSLEEALYLVDSGRVVLLRDGVPMDTAAVYALLARTPGAMDQYLVYAYLRRAGHIVRRVGTTPPFQLTETAADVAANAAEMEMDRRDYEFLRSLDCFAPIDLGLDDDEEEEGEEDEEGQEDGEAEEEEEKEEDEGQHEQKRTRTGASDDGNDNGAATATAVTTAATTVQPANDKIEPCFHLFTTLVKNFKRSAPGVPDFCCVVRSYAEPFPTITESLRMLEASRGVPLLLCVVQGSSLTFFSMQLPHHRTATTRVRRAPPERKAVQR